jgi:hypothetical protein
MAKIMPKRRLKLIHLPSKGERNRTSGNTLIYRKRRFYLVFLLSVKAFLEADPNEL